MKENVQTKNVGIKNAEALRNEMVEEAKDNFEVANFMRLLEWYCWPFFYEVERFATDKALIKCYRRLLNNSNMSRDLKEKYSL